MYAGVIAMSLLGLGLYLAVDAASGALPLAVRDMMPESLVADLSGPPDPVRGAHVRPHCRPL